MRTWRGRFPNARRTTSSRTAATHHRTVVSTTSLCGAHGPALTYEQGLFHPIDRDTLWAPAGIREAYALTGERIYCTATYANFRRFQVKTHVEIGN